MKTNTGIQITILFILLCVILPAASYAQDCDAVLFMKEGALLTYTDYTKKGKKLGSSEHKTTSITEESGSYTAIIQATKKDEKDKETFSTSYKAECKAGLFSVDMIRFFNFDKLSEQQKEGLSLEIDGDVLEFPTDSEVGDTMDDGYITIKLNNQGFTLVTMTFDVKNRKIVTEEDVTTPAGTFACQKVTFDFESKFGILKVKGSGIEWYHDNVVIIRSESYNKKGKLTGYHELTKMQ